MIAAASKCHAAHALVKECGLIFDADFPMLAYWANIEQVTAHLGEESLNFGVQLQQDIRAVESKRNSVSDAVDLQMLLTIVEKGTRLPQTARS